MKAVIYFWIRHAFLPAFGPLLAISVLSVGIAHVLPLNSVFFFALMLAALGIFGAKTLGTTLGNHFTWLATQKIARPKFLILPLIQAALMAAAVSVALFSYSAAVSANDKFGLASKPASRTQSQEPYSPDEDVLRAVYLTVAVFPATVLFLFWHLFAMRSHSQPARAAVAPLWNHPDSVQRRRYRVWFSVLLGAAAVLALAAPAERSTLFMWTVPLATLLIGFQTWWGPEFTRVNFVLSKRFTRRMRGFVYPLHAMYLAVPLAFAWIYGS